MLILIVEVVGRVVYEAGVGNGCGCGNWAVLGVAAAEGADDEERDQQRLPASLLEDDTP
jgi:hypothetical protein